MGKGSEPMTILRILRRTLAGLHERVPIVAFATLATLGMLFAGQPVLAMSHGGGGHSGGGGGGRAGSGGHGGGGGDFGGGGPALRGGAGRQRRARRRRGALWRRRPRLQRWP